MEVGDAKYPMHIGLNLLEKDQLILCNGSYRFLSKVFHWIMPIARTCGYLRLIWDYSSRFFKTIELLKLHKHLYYPMG